MKRRALGDSDEAKAKLPSMFNINTSGPGPAGSVSGGSVHSSVSGSAQSSMLTEDSTPNQSMNRLTEDSIDSTVLLVEDDSNESSPNQSTGAQEVEGVIEGEGVEEDRNYRSQMVTPAPDWRHDHPHLQVRDEREAYAFKLLGLASVHRDRTVQINLKPTGESTSYKLLLLQQVYKLLLL